MSDAADLGADYAQAGFAATLGWGRRPALVVVDVAVAYLQPGSPLYADFDAVVDSIGRLIAAARETATPIWFTSVAYRPGGADGGMFFKKVPPLRCFEAGNPLGRLTDRLERRPEDGLVVKQYASAFFGTSLASSLTASGVDTVVLTGLTTSGCIRASAVDALQHGFRPIVVREAVGDRHPGPHDANLFDLQAKYADVVSEREAIATLRALAAGAAESQGATP